MQETSSDMAIDDYRRCFSASLVNEAPSTAGLDLNRSTSTVFDKSDGSNSLAVLQPHLTSHLQHRFTNSFLTRRYLKSSTQAQFHHNHQDETQRRRFYKMPPPRGAWNPIECAGDYTTTKSVYNDTYPAIDPTKADQSGKAIFVSGASKGLGKAMAISFAKAGASRIAIGARSDLSTTENEARAAAMEAGRSEPQILKLKLDITDQESVDAAAKLVEREFGSVDVVINNAGIMDGRGSVAESDP